MNPYNSSNPLLFTCIDGPIMVVVNHVLTYLSLPDQWSPRDSQGMVIQQYFLKKFDSDAPYNQIVVSSDSSLPLRIVFWEPLDHPGKTVFVGNCSDGLSHLVFNFSEDSPFTWINVRIYEDALYPGCFFDFYANKRNIERNIYSSKDEEGWTFFEEGPLQPFEEPTCYKNRLKKDRITKQLITNYLGRLGFNVKEEPFWRTSESAYLLWQERPNLPIDYSHIPRQTPWPPKQ